MKIKFKKTVTVQAAGGDTFEAGATYDLPDASAQHWLNRGVAESVEKDQKTGPKPIARDPVKSDEAKPAAKTDESSAEEDSPVSDTNATEAIDAVSRMRSEDRLNAVISSDKRTSVVEAAKKRLAEVKGS